MGVESGRRIGERLYVYFAGYAVGTSLDDVNLLMASGTATSPDALLSLHQFRTLIQTVGLFDQVLYVLDCDRLPGAASLPAPLDFAVTPTRPPEPVSEVVLASSNLTVGVQRGPLTSAILDRLGGAATDTSVPLTSAGLADAVRAQLLADVPAVDIDVVTTGLPFVLGNSAAEKRGTLIVEALHWAATVRIFDSSLRPVPNVGPLEAHTVADGGPRSETSLAPGVYRVEMTVEGVAQQQLGIVAAGKKVRIRRKSWDGLSLTSAAPLSSTTTGRDRHALAAERLSREVTWTSGPGGPSRLFLFVRSVDARTAKTFVDGFYLLNAQGELLVDFPAGGERNMRAGYFAFTADLPAGCYLLQLGRSGDRLRYQPIYLCQGWETHVFVSARSSPSLRTLTVNMAPLGRGFRADDQSADAVAAVLAGLRRGQAASVVTTTMVLSLLRGKLENPWLGVVAGYALLEAVKSGVGELDRSGARALLEQTLVAVEQISDHPDVRALRLKDDLPAEAPFWYPPLLVAGLRRVREHATRFADTVPLDSLTDCVLDRLAANGAWTAWGQLDRLPLAPPTVDTPTAGGERLRTPGPAPTPAPVAVSPTISGYRAAPPDPSIISEGAGPTSIVANTVPLEHAALLSVTQTLTQSNDFDSLPESISVNAISERETLLRGVQPQEVSQSSGVSLARTEQVLESLRNRSVGAVQSVSPAESPAPIQSLIASAVLQHALSGRRSSGGPVSSDPPSSDPGPPTPSPSMVPPVTVSEVVAKLRAEGDRLARGASYADRLDADEVRTRADTLYEIAAELLRRAELVAITDHDGVLLYGRLEFLALFGPLSPRLDWSRLDARGLTAEDRRADQAVVAEQRHAQQRAWEDLLRTSTGRSVIVVPPGNPISSSWELQRTAVKDDVTGAVRAYVNVVRAPGAAPLDQPTLEQLGERLSSLTLCSSSLARTGEGGRAWDLQRLDEWIAGTRALLHGGSAVG
jgi:hypothetical protein